MILFFYTQRKLKSDQLLDKYQEINLTFFYRTLINNVFM